MVFSSPPLYLDPPSWHQQSNNIQPQGNGSCNEIPHHHHPFPPLPPPAAGGGGGGGGGVGAMISHRARLAKITQPEVALKCPRCDSVNTKFCYFNNYNLSQPRHFCKTCRRYWTKGGALRNVPVGGGCRRNKKSKNSSDNNNSMNKLVERSQNGNNSNSSSNTNTNTISNSTSSMVINGGPLEFMNHHPQLSFMESNHNLANQFGLSFNGFQGGSNNLNDQLGFHVAGSQPGLSINGRHDILSAGAGGGGGGHGGGVGGGLHRFPLFEPLTGLFSFQCNKSDIDQYHHQQQEQRRQQQQKECETSFSIDESEKITTTIPLMAPPSIKDENGHLLNLSRSTRFPGASISSEMNNNNQYLSDGRNFANNLSDRLNSSSVNHII